MKILTTTNLSRIWDTIKAKFATKEEVGDKVDKVEGKGLSTNDLTNDLLTKLNGAASSEDLEDKVDKVDGKGLSANDYTDTEKEKLEAVESGAQVNVLETVKVNGTALTATDKGVNIDLSDYATNDDVDGKVDKVTGKGLSTNDLTDDLVDKINAAVTPDTLTQAVAEAGHIKFSFVDELPEEGQANLIYFTKLEDAEEEDAYEEFVFQNGAYEKIGATRVDLSNYWDKANLEVATDADIDAALGVEGE